MPLAPRTADLSGTSAQVDVTSVVPVPDAPALRTLNGHDYQQSDALDYFTLVEILK